MEVLLALIIGILYASGLFLLLRRHLIRIVIGLALLANATNLLLFTGAGVTRGAPPLIAPGETALAAPYGDPLPQALILTAIVIAFGVQAFALVLVYIVNRELGTDDPDILVRTDSGEEEPA